MRSINPRFTYLLTYLLQPLAEVKLGKGHEAYQSKEDQSIYLSINQSFNLPNVVQRTCNTLSGSVARTTRQIALTLALEINIDSVYELFNPVVCSSFINVSKCR